MFELLWKIAQSVLVTGALTAIGLVVAIFVTWVLDRFTQPRDGQALGMLFLAMMFIFGIIGLITGVVVSVNHW